jgi:hypothetical protein
VRHQRYLVMLVAGTPAGRYARLGPSLRKDLRLDRAPVGAVVTAGRLATAKFRLHAHEQPIRAGRSCRSRRGRDDVEDLQAAAVANARTAQCLWPRRVAVAGQAPPACPAAVARALRTRPDTPFGLRHARADRPRPDHRPRIAACPRGQGSTRAGLHVIESPDSTVRPACGQAGPAGRSAVLD